MASSVQQAVPKSGLQSEAPHNMNMETETKYSALAPKGAPGWVLGTKISKRGAERLYHILPDVGDVDLKEDPKCWGPPTPTLNSKVIEDHLSRFALEALKNVVRCLGGKPGRKKRDKLVAFSRHVYKNHLKTIMPGLLVDNDDDDDDMVTMSAPKKANERKRPLIAVEGEGQGKALKRGKMTENVDGSKGDIPSGWEVAYREEQKRTAEEQTRTAQEQTKVAQEQVRAEATKRLKTNYEMAMVVFGEASKEAMTVKNKLGVMLMQG